MTTELTDAQRAAQPKPWQAPAIKRFDATGASQGPFNEVISDGAGDKS